MKYVSQHIATRKCSISIIYLIVTVTIATTTSSSTTSTTTSTAITITTAITCEHTQLLVGGKNKLRKLSHSVIGW